MATREMTVELSDGSEVDAVIHYDYEPSQNAPDGRYRGSVWICKATVDGGEVYLSDKQKVLLEDVLYQMERQTDR
jgi:hypothetical protein